MQNVQHVEITNHTQIKRRMNFVQCGQKMDVTFDLGIDLFFEQDLLPVLDSQPNVIYSLDDMDNSLSDKD